MMASMAMPKIAFLLLLGLCACATGDSAMSGGAPVTMEGWRLASGKAPTRAEFGAIVAMCQDRARDGTVREEACLHDLGLRRSP